MTQPARRRPDPGRPPEDGLVRHGRSAPAEPPALATVRDLLAVPALRLTLVAGTAGLDRPIRWAHSIELADPRPYLRGQELVLTMGSLFVDDASAGAFVEAVLDRDAGGIGFGCGNYHPSAPDALRRACDAAGLPLVEVPFDVPFLAITEELAERLAARRSERDRRAHRREMQLLDLLAEDRGLDGIAASLVRELGGSLAVATAAGRVLAAAGDERAAAASALAVAAAVGSDRRPAPAQSLRPLEVVAVRHAGRVVGWIGWLRPASGAPPDSAEVLRDAAPIVSIELATRAAERARDRRAVGRVLEMIASGLADPVVLADRLGPDGGGSEIVASVWPAGDADAIEGSGAFVLVAEARGRTYGLARSGSDVTSLAAARHAAVGVGSAVRLAGLRRSLAEAEAAAALAIGRGAVVTAQDLATVPALLDQLPRDRLAAFATQLIVPLVEYDTRGRTSLVGTLRAFIDEGGSVDATAHRLHVHVNTLRYRLRRIRAITGRDPSAFLDRVSLYVGLWAWDASSRRIERVDGTMMVESDN